MAAPIGALLLMLAFFILGVVYGAIDILADVFLGPLKYLFFAFIFVSQFIRFFVYLHKNYDEESRVILLPLAAFIHSACLFFRASAFYIVILEGLAYLGKYLKGDGIGFFFEAAALFVVFSIIFVVSLFIDTGVTNIGELSSEIGNIILSAIYVFVLQALFVANNDLILVLFQEQPWLCDLLSTPWIRFIISKISYVMSLMWSWY